MTTEEASIKFCIKGQLIRSWISKNYFPSAKIGYFIHFEESDLVNYMAKHNDSKERQKWGLSKNDDDDLLCKIYDDVSEKVYLVTTSNAKEIAAVLNIPLSSIRKLRNKTVEMVRSRYILDQNREIYLQF